MCKQIYIGKVTPLSHRMLPAPRHSSEHPGRGGFEYLGDEKSSIMDEKSTILNEKIIIPGIPEFRNFYFIIFRVQSENDSQFIQ